VDDEVCETKQRQIIFIDMEIQLTPEDKKSLSRYFIYIRSFGSTTANATCYFEYGSFTYGGDVYTNGRRIEKFKPVELLMERILDNIEPDNFENDEFHDQDELDYFSIDFDFDCLSKTIDVNCNFSVRNYDDAGSSGEIPEEVFDKIFKEYSVTKIVCTYNGGGDSGYIESDMELGGDTVPTPSEIEDYCYTVLEDFGGWEINEGSQGNITFNLKSKEYSINHQWNTEELRNFSILTIQV
jgi:hypothetical protein